METRLRNLRQRQKGKKLIDIKLGQISLSGKGNLTDKAKNLFQNCYGMAIQHNVDNLYNTQKSVWAVLFHSSDIEDENICHQFCPRTKTSWCLWQSDKLTYQKKLSLPLAIHKVLIPIFKDLSNQDLLKKCLHGQTQNNESLNGVIWKRCPKDKTINESIYD
ncbi:uncharacterized protein LOC136092192 [Hydra vulgaris]|uniref:Uncharacterized protein LOC136092192 n=1 Tax=Hydra vulgaris TaxID=6087 RepID=A0ABM4DN74_HYDVU